jgi:hypothetical protein
MTGTGWPNVCSGLRAPVELRMPCRPASQGGGGLTYSTPKFDRPLLGRGFTDKYGDHPMPAAAAQGESRTANAEVDAVVRCGVITTSAEESTP